jgi:hypothetical protein
MNGNLPTPPILRLLQRLPLHHRCCTIIAPKSAPIVLFYSCHTASADCAVLQPAAAHAAAANAAAIMLSCRCQRICCHCSSTHARTFNCRVNPTDAPTGSMNRNFAAAAAVSLPWLRHRCCCAANAAVAENVLLLLPTLLLPTLPLSCYSAAARASAAIAHQPTPEHLIFM